MYLTLSELAPVSTASSLVGEKSPLMVTFAFSRSASLCFNSSTWAASRPFSFSTLRFFRRSSEMIIKVTATLAERMVLWGGGGMLHVHIMLSLV